ncbi:MAG: extracellular solute-binding protein [bacterium]|nr:extracellular solute-binding protein [bacterium]
MRTPLPSILRRLPPSAGTAFRPILAAAMLLIAACAGRNPHRILVWHSMRPVEADLLRKHLAEFGKQHPGWEFGELYYQNETARTNFIISALGGSGPELFWGASDNIGPFNEMRVIQPLEPFFTPAFLDSFLTEPFAANTRMDGHLYQIADRVGNHLCLVYNKKIISKPPETMSELIRVGKKLTRDLDGDGRPDRYALVWNYTEPFFAIPFIGGFGGWIIDGENRPTLNTPAMVRACRFIWELGHTHRIIPAECDYEIANALFKDGLAAMIINGSWSWGTYIENGIDIGIARIPKIDETGLWPAPMVSPLGYSLNVNAKGEKREIALELMRYLTSMAVQLDFTRLSVSLPSRRDGFDSPAVRGDPLASASLDQMRVGRLMPPVTEMRWIWDAMRPGYQAIFRGALTPERAAADMQALAEKLIRENRE